MAVSVYGVGVGVGTWVDGTGWLAVSISSLPADLSKGKKKRSRLFAGLRPSLPDMVWLLNILHLPYQVMPFYMG